MPVYLLHGFRWPRPAIRIHIILNNLDDAAPEWLVAPATSLALVENLKHTHPNIMSSIPHLRFIEQYDPADEVTKSQPYAYVADIIHEVHLNADIEEKQLGLKNGESTGLVDLRDILSKEEKIGWFVVVCGDEERSFSRPHTPMAEAIPRGSNGTWFDDGSKKSMTSASTQSREGREDRASNRQRSNSISRGFRRMFRRNSVKKSESLKHLQNTDALSSSISTNSPPVPPLPGSAH